MSSRLNKAMLTVYWKWNRRTWVTKEILLDWFTNCFCPSMLHFCQEKELPAKALLLLDSAPGHPANLAEVKITPGHQYCLHATKHHIIFATSGPGGNRNLLAYYLCHTFINWWEFWTGHIKQTRITGPHSTFWRALITSMQLGKNCQ
jgi:hypothetical protein